MFIRCAVFSVCFLVLVGFKVNGSEKSEAKTGNTIAEMKILTRECTVCHGVREAQRGPILNGMDHWYLSDQIHKFRSGIRGARSSNKSEYLMGVGTRKVTTDLQVAFLSNWFANQEPTPALRTIRGDVELGRELYQRRCASCHGVRGEGNRLLLSPSLNKLEGWYFLEQMRKFRSGERGYHLRDEGGKIMAAASKDFSDYDLKNIVAYSVEAFGLPEAQAVPDRTEREK